MTEVERTEFSSELARTSRGSISESSEQANDSYMLIPYGFQPRSCYKPKAKSKEITGVAYNSRSRQFIILDSKGIGAWSHNSVINAVSRLLDYPPYQFNLIQLMLHSKKFNVYFGLSKDYVLKVFNLNFHEVFSVTSDMNSVLCMVFNSVTDELITGGTGGIKFWTFGEIQSNDRSLSKDSRPMANYGLILRREHLAVNGTMVKDIILDEKNQRLYCLSERNVVAHDMKGNVLFELKSAHQGQVTGCVYSKFSNFVVTAGTDCAVNVWSSNGGCLHSFCSHSKIVTNLLLHPEAPSLVITSSQDGTVKIFSLDIMEEIYSQVVFPESIEWMSLISQDLLYCATSKALQVFSINHVTNFWTTARCPLRSISLTADSHGRRQKVLAIAEDYSARFLTKDGRLHSTVLPPPRVSSGQQLCSAHAYCPLYGLMYVLVNHEEIWVYYTRSNPANRVEVWNLSDMQDISTNRESTSRDDIDKCYTPSSLRAQSSASPFNPPAKIVDGVPCLSLAFLHSTVNLKNKAGEVYPDLTYYLVAGLQDGRLLFTSPFSALVLYFQFQATKGAVLSIKHDVNAGLLLLNTMTLDKYSIQIRSLPDLNIKHNIEAGDDLTSFVRMGCSVLTGHETGRLNLYRLNPKQVTCEVETRKYDGQKISNDHLDSVLTVDTNNELQLFCSCSKDGSIKIWNHSKVLLREIIMDTSLTTVCFLNSSGDLLAGFKNHIFSISREKAHLISYSNSSRRNSELHETGSDIYEDPRVRFEYKKIIPSDPVCMETYLVPFANISINLERFLSGQVPQSSLENDMESDDDGTKSEFSDVFSVAPTDIYMSQNGTPHSRSRSSSLVSSWNLPNIGASPVSSPPRTPPPFMSPVLELESEDEMATPDNEALEDSLDKYLTSGNEAGKTISVKKDVKPTPIFSRQKRPGLSDWKIDSRSLQSKASVNVTKNADSFRSIRAKEKDSTKPSNATRSSRPGRTIVKKTKKQSGKSQRKAVKSEQLSLENIVGTNDDQEENDIGQNCDEENTIDDQKENATVGVIKARQPGEDVQNNTTLLSIDNKTDTQTSLHENMPGEDSLVQEQIKEQASDVLEAENEELSEAAIEEPFAAATEAVESDEEDLLVLSNAKEDEINECTSMGYGDIDNDKTDKNEIELKEDALPQPVKVSRENSLNIDMTSLHLEPHEQREFPGNSTDLDEDLECSDSSGEDRIEKESHVSLKSEFENEHEHKHKLDSKNEKADKLHSKSVSFVVGDEQFKHRKSGPTRSSPRRKISNRHSVSPVNFTRKVVPVLDSPPSHVSYGQRLPPSSALKIYALAKTRQRTASGRSLVSRPLEKQRSFIKHNTSEMSIVGDFTMNDSVDRSMDRIPKTFVDIPGDDRIPKTNVDTRSDGVMIKDKERPKEKKDLINWCINALSEKAKYPIFSPRPRLKSRRSELRDEAKSSNDMTMGDIDDSPDVGKTSEKRRKHERQRGFETGLSVEDKFNGLFYVEGFQRKASRSPEVSALDYSEGWQERRLERAREMKAKHLERKQKVLKKRVVDNKTLEDKRHLVELYGSTVKSTSESCGLDVDKTHGSCGIDVSKEDRINIDNRGYQATQSDGKDLKRVNSNYENFKNNPVIIQPYRLERSNATKDELLLQELNVDVNTTELPDRLMELIPRPKSAPSIPSKCRKYVLVDNDSEKSREIPVPTALEEMLMLQRFPKSDLGKSRSRSSSPFVSEIKRPYLLQKMQDLNMSCK